MDSLSRPSPASSEVTAGKDEPPPDHAADEADHRSGRPTPGPQPGRGRAFPIALGLVRDILFDHDMDAVLQLGYTWRPPDDFAVPDPITENATLFSASEVDFETELAVKNGRLLVEGFRYRFGANEVVMNLSKAPSVRRDPEYDLRANIGGDPNYLKRVTGRSWPLPPPAKSYGFPDEAVALPKTLDLWESSDWSWRTSSAIERSISVLSAAIQNGSTTGRAYGRSTSARAGSVQSRRCSHPVSGDEPTPAGMTPTAAPRSASRLRSTLQRG